jgi:uncharacterized protein
MAEVFIDTAFLIALLRARDPHHEAAAQLAHRLAAQGAPLVTTDAVLLELANFFARSPLRIAAIDWSSRLRTAEGWSIEPLDRVLIGRGEARYKRFAEKNWSLTDCISMEVMELRGIREIATTDGGFAQAGFSLLL